MTALPDYSLPDPPRDPVSAVSFNSNRSKANELLISSWDKTVRLYRLPPSHQEGSEASSSSSSAEQLASQIHLVHTFQHEAAVLDVCWISDTLAASGGLDRRVRLLNLETGQSNIIGKHNSAISRIRYSSATNLLLSTSWDCTLKVWDPKSSSPSLLHTITLPDKVLAMDLSPPFTPSPSDNNAQGASSSSSETPCISDATPRAVVAMAGRHIYIFNLALWRQQVDKDRETGAKEGTPNNQQQQQDGEGLWKAEQKRESSLKFMVRDIKCMPSGDGYATSSVEGRITVDFFDASPEAQAKKYAFKCHRQVIDGIDTVYPVNAMAFHPVYATFASLGGDAVLSIWDPLARKRIKQFPKMPSPLSTGALSPDGKILAVACGFENIEDTRHQGDAPGEVGEMGRGGEGNVCILIKSATEDFKPKSKTLT